MGQQMMEQFGQVSDRFTEFHSGVSQWLACERAAAEVLAGADYPTTFNRLHDNGSWGMVPWPYARLMAAAEQTKAAVKTQSAPLPFKRHSKYALDAMTFALAKVLGVKVPW